MKTSMVATLPLAVSADQISSGVWLANLTPYLLAGGWLLLIFMTLWLVWETYLLIKGIDYVSAIEWTYLQITLPPDAEQTPKAMEIF